jgi:hypothetical protein
MANFAANMIWMEAMAHSHGRAPRANTMDKVIVHFQTVQEQVKHSKYKQKFLL